ncbi:MAG: arsenate reductase ArsC [Nitrosopumilus sp.]|nr:arsenate reductase ArsC [Nitrosopumilus sp.]
MPENILFACVENAGRSQMAEVFFRKFTPSRFSVFSVETTSSFQFNLIAIQVMKEIGIDVMNQHPKLLSVFMIKNSSKTVNMGCVNRESCLSLFVKYILDWNISIPKEKSLDEVRIIRDTIKFKVTNLIKTLEATS